MRPAAAWSNVLFPDDVVRFHAFDANLVSMSGAGLPDPDHFVLGAAAVPLHVHDLTLYADSRGSDQTGSECGNLVRDARMGLGGLNVREHLHPDCNGQPAFAACILSGTGGPGRRTYTGLGKPLVR